MTGPTDATAANRAELAALDADDGCSADPNGVHDWHWREFVFAAWSECEKCGRRDYPEDQS